MELYLELNLPMQNLKKSTWINFGTFNDKNNVEIEFEKYQINNIIECYYIHILDITKKKDLDYYCKFLVFSAFITLLFLFFLLMGYTTGRSIEMQKTKLLKT